MYRPREQSLEAMKIYYCNRWASERRGNPLQISYKPISIRILYLPCEFMWRRNGGQNTIAYEQKTSRSKFNLSEYEWGPHQTAGTDYLSLTRRLSLFEQSTTSSLLFARKNVSILSFLLQKSLLVFLNHQTRRKRSDDVMSLCLLDFCRLRHLGGAALPRNVLWLSWWNLSWIHRNIYRVNILSRNNEVTYILSIRNPPQPTTCLHTSFYNCRAYPGSLGVFFPPHLITKSDLVVQRMCELNLRISPIKFSG